MILALASPPVKGGHPLYPGYRLLPQAKRAMSSLCSRIAASPSYLEGVEKALGMYGVRLRETWSERVSIANSEKLGSQYMLADRVRFPDQLESGVP